MSWQWPGSDCHTAGLSSNAFEVDTIDRGCLKILCNYDCLSTRSLRQNVLDFKCSSMLTITQVRLEKKPAPCIQTMCYWSGELEKRGNITKT